MIREPAYTEDVKRALFKLQIGSDLRLLHAVCDAIDLICDRGNSREARVELLVTENGNKAFRVPVRDSRYDWCLLWWPKGAVAHVYYIGEL